MEKTVRVIICLFMALLGGCEMKSVYMDVIQGNYHYGRGSYQQAIVSYLRALESGKHTEWVEYNLGNAYHSLGETQAALALWEKAALTSDPALRFHIAYNKGCLYYELGKYREAAGEFRYALKLEPPAMDAKINLELSLRKMASGGQPAAQAKNKKPGSGDEGGRILDYVKRKEGNRWKATDRIDDSGSEDW